MTAVSTLAEKWWIAHVVALGCVVCRKTGLGESPAVYHHIRTGQGAAQRAGNGLGLPLCPAHHTDGGYGVAYHAGPKVFEAAYGSELELLNETILAVAENTRCGVFRA